MSIKNKTIAFICGLFVIGMAFTIYKLTSANSNNQLASKAATQQIQSQSSQNPSDENSTDNSTSAGNTTSNSVLGDSAQAPTQNSHHGSMQNLPAGSKPFFGQIASVSDSQITLSSRNNTTTTVTFSDNTSFTGGTKDNLANGARIAGYGTANSDGSITAQSITINPTMPSGSRFNKNGANSNSNSN